MHAFRAIICACLLMSQPVFSQTAALTAEERALCRPDALKFCFFKIGQAEDLRQCLQDNRADLSAACQGLLAKRGN
jgi:hypothetical protein